MEIYRAARKCYLKKIPFIPNFLFKINRLINNSYVPFTAEIGEGTKFAYGGISNVVAPYPLKIGRNCSIGIHACILGMAGKPGFAEIGDNVFIGAGTIILGPVKIGENTIIGANSTVIRDLPANCVAVGSPCKVIKTSVEEYKHLDYRMENTKQKGPGYNGTTEENP